MQAQKDDVMTAVAAPVPLQAAADAARAVFGIRAAKVSPLESERDINFRVTAEDGALYVLKFTNPAEDEGVTDLQVKVLQHIERADPDFAAPRAVGSLSGAAAPIVDGRALRLSTWVDGTPLGDGPVPYAALGATLARLTRALQGFSHPSQRYDMMWDLTRAPEMKKLLQYVPEAACVEKYLAPVDTRDFPVQVVHNDFNPHNVLARADGSLGVIDFGDILYTPRIHDLAIACAYHMHQGQAAVEEIVSGYLPLRADERAALYPLIGARVAMALCINHWRAALYPENAAYILANAPRARKALEVLDHVDA